MPQPPEIVSNTEARSSAEMLEVAIDYHRDGHIDKAEPIYRKILEQDVDHGRALYYLGLIASQSGDLEAAADLMSRGLALDSDYPSAQNNLGAVYQGLGRLDEAAICFKAAIALNSDLLEAHQNLGALFQLTGLPEKAEACYQHALTIDPNYLPALNNLGAVFQNSERGAEALTLFERVLRIQPSSVETHNNIGLLQRSLGDQMSAVRSFNQAIHLNPEMAEAYNNLGSTYRSLGNLDHAAAAYERAISLKPEFAEALNNLGALELSLGKLDHAQDHLRSALAFKPEFPDALANLGLIHAKRGAFQDAMECYRDALTIDPDHAESLFNMSEITLFSGDDLINGWQAHEARWRKRDTRLNWRDFPSPLWQGQELTGRTILVWGEQGVGEEIMYASMVGDLQDMGARVLMECEPRLVPLFRRSFAKVDCIPRTDPPEAATGAVGIDFNVPAGNLGRWLRPDRQDFNRSKSFICADAVLQSRIREKYREESAPLLVGVSWKSGNTDIGVGKSLSLSEWLPVLSVPGIKFVNLQYGDVAAECVEIEAIPEIKMITDSEIDQLKNLDDFAAQVAALDLVITVSNTTAHMASGLGVPTWIMLSAAPLWKWFSVGEKCPWYPSARLFRQEKFGEWDGVVEDIRTALVDFAQMWEK